MVRYLTQKQCSFVSDRLAKEFANDADKPEWMTRSTQWLANHITNLEQRIQELEAEVGVLVIAVKNREKCVKKLETQVKNNSA